MNDPAMAKTDAVSECHAIEWRYYLAMTVPFATDVIVSGIVTWILGLPAVFARNLLMATAILLFGIHLGARLLFRPIRRFLESGQNFAAIERRLTQLPLLSAYLATALYFPLVTFRIVTPLVFQDLPHGFFFPEFPPSTWTDAVVTVFVSIVFIRVIVYFLISSYLERLCLFLFERHGVNLGLFFGRFSRKVVVALGFIAVAPLALIAGEIVSYSGERLISEVVVDFSVSAFGLTITLFWVSRSLTRPMARLGTGIGRVSGGDLGVRLPVTSNEEIGELTARFNQMVEGLRERQRIRETFGKYVSESVASALLTQTGDSRLSGETREATLMFTDIEGFTSLAERLSPDILIAVLNEYLEVVVEPIQRRGGVVNSFIGDGLFASFNMPLKNETHATSAVAAALAIQHALTDRAFTGGVRLTTRIGINSGTVIGGTVGAGERLSYTILGDAVNTASRLQELNKAHGTRILIAEATRRLAGDGFRFRRIGEVPIRGRQEPLIVYTTDAG
jgi:class 3 adenylate cyclase